VLCALGRRNARGGDADRALDRLKHDQESMPTRWVDTGFPKRSCANKKIERDDDSKKSHRAVVAARFTRKIVGALTPSARCFLAVCCGSPRDLSRNGKSAK
jgi:hypothetical protein